MIAAMSSVQFVSNVACVRFLHRETVPGRVYAATAAILAGNILMVVFSSKSSPLYTVADLKAFYTRLPYIIYLAALAVGANPAHLPSSPRVGGDTVCWLTLRGTWHVAVVPIAYALFRLGLTKLEQEASISSRGAWVKSVPVRSDDPPGAELPICCPSPPPPLGNLPHLPFQWHVCQPVEELILVFLGSFALHCMPRFQGPRRSC